MKQLAVIEARPRWAPELSRQLASGAELAVRAYRSVRDLQSGNRIPELVLLDLDIGVDQAFDLLSSQLNERPKIVVVGNHKTDVLEASLRELGVVTYFSSSADATRVALECKLLMSTARAL